MTYAAIFEIVLRRATKLNETEHKLSAEEEECLSEVVTRDQAPFLIQHIFHDEIEARSVRSQLLYLAETSKYWDRVYPSALSINATTIHNQGKPHIQLPSYGCAILCRR